MAIEINKRKRKHHSNSEEQDEGLCIPKKIAKSWVTAKRSKVSKSKDLEYSVYQNGSANNSNEPNVKDLQLPNEPDVDEYVTFGKEFKMLNFRTKLRGNNFITELRHFLYLAKIRPKIITKYVEKRGKPLELAEALERVEKKNTDHVAYITEALNLVVMEILSNHSNHLESAIHACRYFLKAHWTAIELLLNSKQFNHRKIALKLLTAFVCVEPQLGRQILVSFNLLTNVNSINQFLSHSIVELRQELQNMLEKKLKEEKRQKLETVRECYIHFVLSYLVDGNTLLIRNILDHGSLLKGLINGLLYDEALTVCMVLNTLKKFVLECVEVSKTKKIHIFDLNCCKSLVQLYDWCGPKVYWAKCNSRKKDEENSVNADFPHEIFAIEQEREMVAKTVHDFLLILLCSRKKGIAFDTVKFFRQKHNTIQGQVIGSLMKPWSSPLKTELICKILEACPDLFRHTVRHYAGLINPLRCGQNFYVIIADFLRHIINSCHPRFLRGALEMITLTDFTYWIKDICLPLESLVHINGSKFLHHQDFQFRLTTNRLLLAMFQQYTNYLKAINECEVQQTTTNDKRKFKFDILNHLLMHFPTVENILTSLNMSIELKDGVDVLAHVDVALDLLLIICQESPTFVNKTTVILDYLELLRPIYADKERRNICLEMKAIKTILLLYPKALEPNRDQFGTVLESFIKAFVHCKEDVSREAASLLRAIFKNTGIFDSCELEIDLWLEALRFFDEATIDVVSQVFNEVLKVTTVDVHLPVKDESVTNTNKLHQLFGIIEKGFYVEGYVESLRISKLMPLIFKGVEIEKPFSDYLECVCMLMFHYYQKPEYMLTIYEMEFNSLSAYMTAWITLDKRTIKKENVTNLKANIPKWSEVVNYIYETQSNIGNFFARDDMKDILQNERLLMIYIQLVLFQILQLREHHLLTCLESEKAAQFINECLKYIQKQQSTNQQDQRFLSELLKYIYSVRLQQVNSQELIKNNPDSLPFLRFLKLLTQHCNQLDNFDAVSFNYKSKLVKTVAISLENAEFYKKPTKLMKEFIGVIMVFQLNAQQRVEILNLLSDKLCYKDYFADISTKEKSFYYELMVNCLEHLASLKKAVRCDSIIKRFSKLYHQFFKKLPEDLNLENLEEAFYKFLLINHHYIMKMDRNFFQSFLVERKLFKFSIKLACLVYEHNSDLNEMVLDYLALNGNKKELMYPLLSITFKKNLQLNLKVIKNLYDRFKNGFMRLVEKPQKTAHIYKDSVEAAVKLIDHCMPWTECRDLCFKQLNFDSIELPQIKLLQAIFKKAFEGVEDVSKKLEIFQNLILMILNMFLLDLKTQKLSHEKVELLAFLLQQWFIIIKKDFKHSSNDFAKVLNSTQWLQFCKTMLKRGMEEQLEEDSQKLNVLLLQLLAYLNDHLYEDYSEDVIKASVTPETPQQLFELIFQHSKFYDIILSRHNSDLKSQVLYLLFVLAKKHPEALKQNQIPVLLGAYHACMSLADRYCLALLNLYENYDKGLDKFKPFLWGESAISFYALRTQDEAQKGASSKQNLQWAETSTKQVMFLVDRQLCEYTVDNFPIWRKLNTLQQMPVIEFEDPALKSRKFGSNVLEQKLEGGQREFSETELRLCPKREEIYEKCYDPAFMVPLMLMFFAPDCYSHPARPVENGLLSLMFSALSSQDKQMRRVAGCVQLRYRSHFEQSNFFEKPLWLQTYDNIQSGLNELRQSWVRYKGKNSIPRVPFISSLFIAKTLNLTTDPTHLLYKQLTLHLRLQSSFDFQTVPEFNVLFLSTEVENQEYRRFIVQVIRNGLKCSSDVFLLITTNTFKVLMTCYGSTVATLDLNLLILSIFSTCVKIPASAKLMIENVGIISWLRSVMNKIEFHQFDIIEGLISIFNNLWYAMKASEKEFHNFNFVQKQIYQLILQLLPVLTARIQLNSFAKLMNILQKTVSDNFDYMALSSEQLQHILKCAEKHYGNLVMPLLNIFAVGGEGCGSLHDYCQELYDDAVDVNIILGLTSLRSYLIKWWAIKNQCLSNRITNFLVNNSVT